MISDDRLTKSHDILGSPVIGSDAHKLGVIRELFIYQPTGAIAFAVLEAAGGLFGSGGKFHPVPWSLIRWHPDGDSYRTTFDRERFKAAPAYDREQLNSTTYGWGAQTLRFFGVDHPAEPREQVHVVTTQFSPH